MSKIKVLDESTIQQIAAGEVIERPASIVKELVENSIDANSDKITIEIKEGGKSYIRITDNGHGMDKDDIDLAFKRHSTSKLSTIDDIYSVLSLGFRGEALASVASVSKVEVLSKTKDSDVGTQTLIEGGEIKEKNTIGSPKGTSIIVRELFYNLPVRRKFLKGVNIESNHISDIINKLALGNPKISFNFINDGRNLLKTRKNSRLLDTIYSVLGKDYYKNLIPINHSEENIKINGFISNNKLYRSNRNHQYLYINGRYISHLNISKIIKKEYRSLVPLNRLPVFILNLDIDPNRVDVNIHPTKQEIKFIDSEEIYDTISEVVRDNLMPSLSVPKMEFDKKEEKKDDLPKLFNSSNEEIQSDDGSKENPNIVIKDLTEHNYTESHNSDSKTNDKYSSPENKFEKDWAGSLKNLEFDLNNNNIKSNEKKIEFKEDEVGEAVEQTVEDILLDIDPIGRVFNTYIIAESKKEEKLFFIDQHAAHERVMYERYKKEFEEEEIVIQQLISPAIIDLTAEEKNIVDNNIGIFEKLGFELDNFGDSSVALRGVPMVFGEPKIKSLFLDVLDSLSTNIETSYDTKVEKIMKIACTNAIKSGDKMDNMEIIALFKSLKECDNPYTCPHGRPTIMEFSKREIEKSFLRTL